MVYRPSKTAIAVVGILAVITLLAILAFAGPKPVAPQPSIMLAASPASTITPVRSPTPNGSVAATDWHNYQNQIYGFGFRYPSDWIDSNRPLEIGDFFTASGVGVLSVTTHDTGARSVETFVQSAIIQNNCQNTDGRSLDRVIRSDRRGVLYVLYCSATSEDYIFAFQTSARTIIQLVYHDAFDENWALDDKLAQFSRIIDTITIAGQVEVTP
jgi:hypothetical protein